jgi:hypothetical protein
MSSVKIVLNSEGIQELLKSAEVMAECRSHAAEMAATLGADDYEVSEYVGSTRVNVSVRAKTDKAIKDNYENNTMLKAVGND